MKVLFYPSHKIFGRPEVVSRLRFLTNGGWGRSWAGSGMMDDLDRERKGWMFLAWEKGEIIGWAYVSKRRWDEDLQVGTYVQRKWRRKGVGSRLLQKVREFAKEKGQDIVSQGWNDAGLSFYKKNNIPYTGCWDF